ncbi:PAS domain S-box protein [Halobellus sp. GM3]|uniref:PAS domain S-box protein n=1 Tax=Halobellus sp. GM3 TaxID=3458410 RepID=UPI00403DF077
MTPSPPPNAGARDSDSTDEPRGDESSAGQRDRRSSAKPLDPEPYADDASGTVQLIVADRGNRTAIRSMLSDHFDVVTGETLREADLYLVEDHLFGSYHETLRDRVEREAPAFCPVVLIRRPTTTVPWSRWGHPSDDDPVLIDDVVDAPIDRSLLIRRLHSLLIRRQQSAAVVQQVETLERRERTLRRFERSVDSTGNGIAITDSDGTIEYVNPAFEAITGHAERSVVGETPRVLLPSGAADAFTERFWRTMVDRGRWEGELVVERADGTRCIADTSVTGIRDDEGVTEGFVIVFSDVTERIQRERELEHREQELELLRQILTRYLRHNLRNDLNVILGYGQLLEADESLSAAHAKPVEAITRTAERLLEKSDTARTYSSLLARDVALSPIDLSAVVTDAVSSLREQHPDVDVDLDVPEECVIHARSGVRHAVEELLDNAARYADAASPRVRVSVRGFDGATLTIEDNGTGISEQELAALEQGEETPLSHSTGVGLWLSKWVIEGVGGQITFETTDGGTRVTVEFPSAEQVGSEGLDIPTLQERERRLQTVINRVTDAIVEVDAAWTITLFDQRAEEILGVDAVDALGRDLWDVFSDASETPFEGVFREVMDSRSSQSLEAYYPGIDGWLDVYVYPDFDGGLSFYFRDTTEHNEQQAELQRAYARMEFALSVTDATVWEWDVETDTATTHPDTHTTLGTRVTTGEDFVSGVHPADRARVRDALETAIETDRPYSAEYRVLDGGSVRWIEDYGEVWKTGPGPSPQLVGVAKEITERKEREQQLQERVKELTMIHDATSVFESSDAPLEELLAQFVAAIPGSFQYPDRTEARVSYGESEVATDGFDPSNRALSATAELADGTAIRLDVAVRLDGLPDPDGAVLPEERALVNTLASLAGGSIERRRSQRELERTGDLLANAERLGGVGAWEVDLESEEVRWTEGARRIHGVSRDFDPTVPTVLEFAHPDDRGRIVETVGECLETGERFDLEFRIDTAGGSRRWVRAEGEPAEENGRRTVRGYIQDVTERRERARRFEAIFNQTYQFTGLLEPDGTLIEANESALAFGGLDREDVVGKKVWNAHWFRISEETQAQTRADVERAAAGEFVRRELEVQGADATAVIDFSIRPITDEDGEVVLLVPEGRDISALKARERELERARELLEQTGRLADVGGWEVDAETGDVFRTANLSVLLGLGAGREPSVEEALERIHEADRSTVEAALASALESGEPFDVEVRVRHGDGEVRWLRILGTPREEDGSVRAVHGATQDVTERKEIEAALEAERDLLSGIVETSPVGITVVGADGTISLVNERAEEIYERPRESIGEFTHDDPRWDLVDEDGGAFDDGETPFERVAAGERIHDQIVGIRRPSGERVWVSVNGAPLRDADGDVEKAVFAFEDVTERRQLEAKLQEILGRVTDAFYAVDEEYRFTHVNDRAAELLQMDAEGLIGETLWEQFPEAAESDTVWNAFHTALETQESQGFELYFEPLDFRVEATVYPSETGLSVYFRDVTERRERERELERQNERLEEFASVVSHDLRNPLNVAIGRLSLAREEIDSAHFEALGRALDRMKRIIDDLLLLALEGQDIGAVEPVRLRDAVESAWRMVADADDGLEIELESGADGGAERGPRAILADDDRLRQLLENLFRNAKEHGGEGVTVTVGALEGGFFVEDDGPGIPEAVRSEVFRAGYSTSKDGTGFGLSIVKQIADAHDWAVTVTDGADGGARFEITGVRDATDRSV